MKKITALLLALVMLLGGFVGGFLIGEKKEKDYSSYDVVYKNLKSMSSDELLNFYRNSLKAETSPTQIKYLLDRIIKEDIDIDVKNNMIALYLNHIQYFMSTYTNFITLYSSIMLNNMNTVNYEEATASNKIDDKLLKTLITEIYEAGLKIKMPENNYSNETPYVIVDYEKLEQQYGSFYNEATKDYIEFKEIVQRGELSNADGSYNMDKLSEYMIIANNFINQYPNYPLVSDVVYSYILAAKMYSGTYNVSNEFMPSDEMVESYKIFIEKYPKTPVTPILEALIKHKEEGTNVTMAEVEEWNSSLDSLIG